ncbi:hypothetical protein, partial [Escherichia coli]|uniref:hypothetical protein n=1 Tax=Escherichia coli TaxID=562 RepID=UPI003D8169B1
MSAGDAASDGPVTNIEELNLDDVTDQQVFRTAHQVGHIEQAHRWQHHQQTSGNNSRHRQWDNDAD